MTLQALKAAFNAVGPRGDLRPIYAFTLGALATNFVSMVDKEIIPGQVGFPVFLVLLGTASYYEYVFWRLNNV